jgi:drug/metabolite transporter (DMT)-like permease
MPVLTAYLGVILIWATTPLAIKWSGQDVGFLFGVVARTALGAALGLALLLALRLPLPWHRAARRSYLAATLMMYGGMTCTYWGAQYIPSGLISLLFGFTPFVISLLAAWLLQERSLTPAKLLGIAVGISGLGLIFHADASLDSGAFKGLLAVLAAVLLQAINNVWMKRLNAGLPALSITVGGLLLSLPLFALTWLLLQPAWPATLPVRAGLSIVYLGTVGSVLGFLLYFYVLQRMEAAKVGLITLITPVLGLLLGQNLNGETISLHVWWGSATVLAGLALHQWGGWLLPLAGRELLRGKSLVADK